MERVYCHIVFLSDIEIRRFPSLNTCQYCVQRREQQKFPFRFVRYFDAVRIKHKPDDKSHWLILFFYIIVLLRL